MTKRNEPKSKFNPFLGMPGQFGSVDGTFDSPDEMRSSLDKFLKYLYKHYSGDRPQTDKANIFGFILRNIKILLDENEADVTLTVDPGKGVAYITIPASEAADSEEWKIRKHQIASIYLGSLPVAQIQAQAQLYRLLNDTGRKKIESQNFDGMENKNECNDSG